VSHEQYMQLALDEAWKYQGLTYPNPAVGALLLDKNGAIIAIEAHQKAGDPHAEINCLKAAFLKMSQSEALKNMLEEMQGSAAIHEFFSQQHHGIFEGCTMYVTLEPCAHFGKTPPCALILGKIGLKSLYIGVLDPNSEHSGGVEFLRRSRVNVQSGILEKEAQALLVPFLKWSEGSFVFFKKAQHLNGVIDGGIVSGEASRKHVHALRDKVELLVISGKTVRIDRPTLDARMIDGKAPDVLIYSHEKTFDLEIPLFNVKNRKVVIDDSLDLLSEYKFIMIEGGGTLFKAVAPHVDWVLSYVAPSLRVGHVFEADADLSYLHQQKIDDDILLWSTLKSIQTI
jgi:diaminohydroxyphosphoribosylaminopyrimidine deaminase / 5-amino-6-(5-phosphoribosylamino)uracil reductase